MKRHLPVWVFGAIVGATTASCSQERPINPITPPAHIQNPSPSESRALLEGWISNGDINAHLSPLDQDMMVPKDAVAKLELVHLLPTQGEQREMVFSIGGLTRSGSKMKYYVKFNQDGRVTSVECMGQGQP